VSPTENAAKLRRFLEEVDPSHDVDALPEYLHDDVVLPADILPSGRQGLEGMREHLLFLPTIVQHTSTVEDIVAEGDKVAARVTVRGKHVGDFMGIRADGKRFTMDEMLIAQFRDGKISRFWRVGDVFSLMQQLGAETVAGVSSA